MNGWSIERISETLDDAKLDSIRCNFSNDDPFAAEMTNQKNREKEEQCQRHSYNDLGPAHGGFDLQLRLQEVSVCISPACCWEVSTPDLSCGRINNQSMGMRPCNLKPSYRPGNLGSCPQG